MTVHHGQIYPLNPSSLSGGRDQYVPSHRNGRSPADPPLSFVRGTHEDFENDRSKPLRPGSNDRWFHTLCRGLGSATGSKEANTSRSRRESGEGFGPGAERGLSRGAAGGGVGRRTGAAQAPPRAAPGLSRGEGSGGMRVWGPTASLTNPGQGGAADLRWGGVAIVPLVGFQRSGARGPAAAGLGEGASIMARRHSSGGGRSRSSASSGGGKRRPSGGSGSRRGPKPAGGGRRRFDHASRDPIQGPPPSAAPSQPARQGAGEPPPALTERLQKVLAHAGLGSRRACEEYILQGRVTVDGKVVRELGTRVDPRRSVVAVDGERIRPERMVYYAVFKPKGYVSTNEDPAGRPRVVDLLPETSERVYAVGRLDEESTGLMILTNDGELANRLAHPRFGVEKTYRVLVAGTPDRAVLQKLTEGVWLAEGKARAKRARLVGTQGNATILELVLAEGKNREVRRMLAKLGHKVMSLSRVAIGPVVLRGLRPGEFRPLTHAEVDALRKVAAGLSVPPPRLPKPDPGEKPLRPSGPRRGDRVPGAPAGPTSRARGRVASEPAAGAPPRGGRGTARTRLAPPSLPPPAQAERGEAVESRGPRRRLAPGAAAAERGEGRARPTSSPKGEQPPQAAGSSSATPPSLPGPEPQPRRPGPRKAGPPRPARSAPGPKRPPRVEGGPKRPPRGTPPPAAVAPPPPRPSSEPAQGPTPARPKRKIIGLTPSLSADTSRSPTGRPSSKRPPARKRPPRRALGVRRAQGGSQEEADDATSN